jgi:hypothetical protein
MDEVQTTEIDRAIQLTSTAGEELAQQMAGREACLLDGIESSHDMPPTMGVLDQTIQYVLQLVVT